VQRQAGYRQGVAVSQYVAGGGALMVAGMAGATGNVPIAAVTGTVATGFMAAGAVSQRQAMRGRARAAAVDDLVGRARRGKTQLRGDAGNDTLGGRRERSRYATTQGTRGAKERKAGAAGIGAGAVVGGLGIAGSLAGDYMFSPNAAAAGIAVAATGFGKRRAGRSRIARGNAIDELVARARGQGGLVSRIQSKGRDPGMRGSAGNDRLSPPMPSVGVDGLAYTANTAATLSGSQLARSTRKAPKAAPDQAVADAKAVADGTKARGVRKAAAAPAAAPSTLSRVSTALAKANPFMMVTAGGVMGKTAFDFAKANGASDMKAIGAGAVAAAPMAAAAVAPTVIGRVAPKLAAGLSKAALPLLALSTAIAAARGGIKAAQDGKGFSGIAAGAAWGAADSLTFGLASRGADKVAEVGRAYLTDSARAKAQSTAAAPVDAPGRRPQAALPSTDGQTAGYTRIDPRTGAVVRVQGYKTPT